MAKECGASDVEAEAGVKPLFMPLQIGPLKLANRIVMAPMTRCFSPGGVPGTDVAAYYRRRAENGVGLIVTEGTWIPHTGAANEDDAPCFYGEAALDGWRQVVKEVHAAGGRIMPQLWHVGQVIKPELEGIYKKSAKLEDRLVGPSGMVGGLGVYPVAQAEPMTLDDIEDVIEAYATSAASAYELGFDGVELHAAHGYLIDQFFWPVTNLRRDGYGGRPRDRARFGAEIVREIRRRTSSDFPIDLRISQWKQQDFDAVMAETPQELEALLGPLVDAGVSLFHCSQRRFWEPTFPDSDLNLAGWVKKLSGLPTITVGSVGLAQELFTTTFGASSKPMSIDRLVEMLERGEFDLVAVGRALLVDPDWPCKIRLGAKDELGSYAPEILKRLW